MGVRRWVDRLSLLLLVMAVGAVVGTALPSLLRAAGMLVEESEQAGPPQAPGFRPSHRHPGPGPEPEVLDLDPDDQEPDEDGLHERLGLARGPLLLVDQPGRDGRPAGQLHIGERVRVLREFGDWVLVAQDTRRTAAMGWVQKSGIAIR